MVKAWQPWGLALLAAALCACSPNADLPVTGGGGGGAASDAAVTQILTVRLFETGNASAFDGTVGATHELVVADAASWRTLYARHRPDALLPAVDFANERVVGVILGRPTTGFSVHLERVESTAKGVRVVYREETPAPTSIPIAQLTQPYFFAAIPRTPGSVSFSHIAGAQ